LGGECRCLLWKEGPRLHRSHNDPKEELAPRLEGEREEGKVSDFFFFRGREGEREGRRKYLPLCHGLFLGQIPKQPTLPPHDS